VDWTVLPLSLLSSHLLCPSSVLGILVVGYAVAGYKRHGTPYNRLVSFKMGILSLLLFIIFFLFLYSTRFALHHQ
jgi:hypothetical protein